MDRQTIKKFFYIKTILITLIFSYSVFSADLIETAKTSNNLTVLGTNKGELIFFDLTTNVVTKRIKAHDRPITDISFSTDGQKIASVGGDGVKIWDRATMNLDKLFPVFANNVCFNPKTENQLLISGYGLILIVDVRTGERIHTIPHKGTAKASFNHQGSQIVVTDFNDSVVKIFDLNSNNFIYWISVYWPCHATFSMDDQKIIVSANHSVNIYLINQLQAQTFKHNKSFFHDDGNWILQSDINSKDTQITSTDNAGCLLKIDLSSGQIRTIESRQSMKYSAFFENDQKILLVTANKVLIYDAQSLELIRQQQIFNL